TDGQAPNLVDSITTLSYVAALTQNVRLGFSVFVAPLFQPVIAAKQLADLDFLSDGRLIFCTAPGGPLINRDFEAVGVDFSQRASIADEYIDAIIRLWSSDACSYHGKHVNFHDLSLYPKPVQKPHPPVWIAGGDPRALSRAAKLGTGWMLTTADPRSVVQDIEEYSTSFSKLQEKANGFGRRISDFALDLFACAAGTDEEASRISEKTIRARLDRQAQSAGLKVPSREQIENINLIGSMRSISKKVEKFQQAGVTTLEMKMICWNLDQMKSMIRAISREVMPSF
nr:LLM class flavin-dependent oxidoreductase [Nitrososphaerota archaeon]